MRSFQEYWLSAGTLGDVAPIPKPLHFPTPHRIAPTTAHPAVPSPNAQEKDDPPPTPSIFSTVRCFPNKPPAPAPGGVSAHSWLGRHPRQPHGRDFPPRALVRTPGSPEKAAREVGVCTRQDEGSTGPPGPQPSGCGGG